MPGVSQFSFGGQHDGSPTGERELFLRQFSGEVITAYHQRNVAEQLIYKRSISQGKSAQFPVTGTASAKYFTPGEDILVDQDADSANYLNDIATTERLIKIDRLLVSPVFIDNLDEAMSHYDYRSPFAQELGYSLAEHTDDMLFRTIIRASSTTDSIATATQADGGGDIALGGTEPTSANMLDACFDAAAAMDIANVPKEDRHFVVSPTNYYKLVYNSSNLVTAVNKDVGGAGSISKGVVYMVAGLHIWMSNHFDVNDSGAGGGEDPPAAPAALDSTDHNIYTYTEPASDTGGVAFHRAGIGMVKLKDLTMESEYIIERQGDLVIAKMAFGAAPLRPASCFRLGLSA